MTKKIGKKGLKLLKGGVRRLGKIPKKSRIFLMKAYLSNEAFHIWQMKNVHLVQFSCSLTQMMHLARFPIEMQCELRMNTCTAMLKRVTG